jgi:hypothetical protein
MTVCQENLGLEFFQNKAVVADFNGGKISSDAGLLLFAEVDRKLGFSDALTQQLEDRRDPSYIKHALVDIMRQRLYQIAAGYEDCNDATTLRKDPILKMSCDRNPESDGDLASQPTLSRFETGRDVRELNRMGWELVAAFIRRYPTPPKEIILEFDPTDDPAHGQQEFVEFNGYYDQHMYCPLLIGEGHSGHLITAILRPGNAHATKGARGILRRLVQRLREAWPEVKIYLRADAGFAQPELYELCEELGIIYTIGLITNAQLQRLNAENLKQAWEILQQQQRQQMEEHSLTDPAVRKTPMTVRLLREFSYQAGSWSQPRRVIAKSEITRQGENQRFVVTNHDLPAEAGYEFYTARGDFENRIKEFKLDLKADRLSCARFRDNQFRLFLHVAAYNLFQVVRALLDGTELAKAQVERLRNKIVKVGALVTESTRRIVVAISSSYPYQKAWRHLLAKLHAAEVFSTA